MLTPLHIRLAMAAFDLTNRDLAPHIDVTEGTIGNALKGKSVNSATLNRIADFFQRKGVEFLYDRDAPGVRIRLAAERAAA